MPRLILSWLLGVTLTASPTWAQPARANPWLTLGTWVTAIEQHEPGKDDEAARTLASIPGPEFDATVHHMVFMLGRAHRARGKSAFDDLFQRLLPERLVLRKADELYVDGLITRITRPGLATFLKRAAMLHTDIALFHPHAHTTTIEGTSQLAADGRAHGTFGRPWHWMLARGFLHLVPDFDPEVRLWYQAIANHFWSTQNYTEGVPHIQRALERFPEDAEIQFVRGMMHAAQAGPHLQAAVAEQGRLFERAPRSVGKPRTRFVPSVRSPAAERVDAVRAFRRALAADPDYLEARLQLAHLLALDGRYDEAAKELAIVLERVEDPWHQYLGALFLGRAHEGRGRTAEARAAYEEASRLFPTAQAPRLAISHIDLRAGDRASAMRVFEFLAEERRLDDDPWWLHDAVRAPGADAAWLDRARAAFRALAR